jgi:aspartate/glutamate racemase
MKRVGIVGGIGPESTVVYYVHRGAGRQRLGRVSPPVFINSIDVQRVLRLTEEDPVPGLRDYLLSEIGVLAHVGESRSQRRACCKACCTASRPLDGLTMASVVALITVVAFVAIGWPAWRAARIDPTTALRAE